MQLGRQTILSVGSGNDAIGKTLVARLPNRVILSAAKDLPGRMLQTPFTFYRAADLANTPISKVRVRACGDCHLMNFGGFATPERNTVFESLDSGIQRTATPGNGWISSIPGPEDSVIVT